MSKICVVGSINMDIVTSVNVYPKQGQTVYGKKIMEFPGGKGANQAISCARQGKKVIMIGCIGKDSHGETLMKDLQSNHIDTTMIKKVADVSSGQTTIILDDDAENTIIYVGGANRKLNPADVIKSIRALEDGAILLIQMETPADTVLAAMKAAKEKGMKVILDPAPTDDVTDEIFAFADFILPNVHETEDLTGVVITDEKTAKEAAAAFMEKGVEQGVLKLGSAGSYVFEGTELTFIEAIPVQAIDTIGAGDCFAGAFASALIDGETAVEAAKYANIVAALKVTKRGAQTGMPTMEEVLAFCEAKKLTVYLNENA